MSEREQPWPTVPLGTLATEMCLGKMLDKQKNRGTLKPYLRNVNVRWFSFDLSDLKEMRFESDEEARYELQAGDLVICEGGEPGRAAVWRGQSESAKIQKALHRVRFRSDVYDPSFAMYFLYFGTTTNLFAPNYTGTTIKHLTGVGLSQVRFPIPPLNEQNRIVAKIEELFSKLDAGVAALERVRAGLKRYRAAVLKAAVEGKLTLKSDASCFQKSKWNRIESGIASLEQGWSPRCDKEPAESNEIWGVIKTTAIQPLRFVDYENKRLPKPLTARANLEIRAGDVLMTRAGPRSRAGVTCLVRTSRPRLMVCDKAYRLRCEADVLRPGYLEIALNAPQILKGLNDLMSGISDSGVNLTQQKFLELAIPLPPLRVQAAIEDDVQRRFSILDRLEAEVSADLKRAARLRQSILKRAFAGRLVPQDPADEPAAKLLERVRAGGMGRRSGGRKSPERPAARRSR